MSYTFLDAYSSVQSADSSVVAGSVQRPIINVASIMGALSVTVTGSPSISGTVGASIIGLTPVAVTNIPSVSGTVLVNNGSVVAFQGGSPWNVSSSIIGLTPVSVSNFPTNQNVSGSVVAFISGTVPINAAGSVVAFQGTNPWVIGSIVGTYAEDAGSTASDKGLLVLSMRNDAVASVVGADLDYAVNAVDSAGRTLVRPFAPEESRVEGYISLTSTSVTTLVAAAGAGLRNYITDLWFANTGAATTLVTFTSGGGASTLGFTIAPTGGGSNLPGLVTPIRTGVNETFGIQAATATSVLYATVKGFKAP